MCKIDRLNERLQEAQKELNECTDAAQKARLVNNVKSAELAIDDYNRSVQRRLTTPMALW